MILMYHKTRKVSAISIQDIFVDKTVAAQGEEITNNTHGWR